MTSQNRMNAGAEYVLYRIWATLQDPNGIHAEKLLTCIGALAGYACQAYARQSAASSGADPERALMAPLVDGTLSVWALVARAVRKLEAPVPDIQDIVRQVTGSGPRNSAVFYVTQLWPQILPIAQRFCRKPMQIPVLFGIALQRAIEHTRDKLSPTVGASIAMECAVAMARVVLAEDYAKPAVVRPAADESSAHGLTAPPALASIASTVAPSPTRATRARKRKPAVEAESSALVLSAFVARIPPAARLVTIASLAFVTFATIMHEGDRNEPAGTTREAQQLVSSAPQTGAPLAAQPSPVSAASSDTVAPAESAAPTDSFSAEEMQVLREQQAAAQVATPAVASADTSAEPEPDYPQLPTPPPMADNDEGIMRDENGQPMT